VAVRKSAAVQVAGRQGNRCRQVCERQAVSSAGRCVWCAGVGKEKPGGVGTGVGSEAGRVQEGRQVWYRSGVEGGGSVQACRRCEPHQGGRLQVGSTEVGAGGKAEQAGSGAAEPRGRQVQEVQAVQKARQAGIQVKRQVSRCSMLKGQAM